MLVVERGYVCDKEGKWWSGRLSSKSKNDECVNCSSNWFVENEKSCVEQDEPRKKDDDLFGSCAQFG